MASGETWIEPSDGKLDYIASLESRRFRESCMLFLIESQAYIKLCSSGRVSRQSSGTVGSDELCCQVTIYRVQFSPRALLFCFGLIFFLDSRLPFLGGFHSSLVSVAATIAYSSSNLLLTTLKSQLFTYMFVRGRPWVEVVDSDFAIDDVQQAVFTMYLKFEK
jgi:hypothetical protein